MASAWDFSFRSLCSNDPLPLSTYAGCGLLIVNTASRCHFTPQYTGLEELAARHAGTGFGVLGVPCDDFGGQEPDEAETIQQFCETRFGLTFPLTAKEKVVGRDAHPFYRWAREQTGWLGAPKWNFHKYLIGREGRLVDYFHSPVSPDSPRLASAIERMLAG